MTDLGSEGMQLLARWLSGVYVSFVSCTHLQHGPRSSTEKTRDCEWVVQLRRII